MASPLNVRHRPAFDPQGIYLRLGGYSAGVFSVSSGIRGNSVKGVHLEVVITVTVIVLVRTRSHNV